MIGVQGTVLDVADQHVNGHLRLCVRILSDSRQPRRNQGAQRQVVKAHNGQVLRHAQPEFAGHPDQPGCGKVGAAEEGGRLLRRTEHGREPVPVSLQVPGGNHPGLGHLNAAGRKALPKPLQALLVYVAVGIGVGHKADAPVPHVGQVFPRNAPANFIGQCHVARTGQVEVAVGQHGGNAGQRGDIPQIADEGAGDHHPCRVPAPDILLDGPVVVGYANQRRVITLVQVHHQRAEIGSVKGIQEDVLVIAALPDDRHDAGTALSQVSRGLVGHIAALADQRLDLLRLIS